MAFKRCNDARTFFHIYPFSGLFYKFSVVVPNNLKIHILSQVWIDAMLDHGYTGGEEVKIQIHNEEKPEMVPEPEVGNPDLGANSQGVSKVNSSPREGCTDVVVLIFELDQTSCGLQRGWQVDLRGVDRCCHSEVKCSVWLECFGGDRTYFVITNHY